MPIVNRITELPGIEIPIIQAPMGWIARAPLASAVSNAGGLGIIETSSGELDAIRGEIKAMRRLTKKAVLRQHCPGVRPRSRHRLLCRRPGRDVCDHNGR